MIEWLRQAVEWLGFTPTHRERLLAARLLSTMRRGELQRAQVRRVERLLHYREGLGAGTVDCDSIRLALYGEQRHP